MALIDEIAKLRGQLSAERKVIAERVEKETGMKAPHAMDSGFGGYGHHGSRDGSYHKGGYGGGCAW